MQAIKKTLIVGAGVLAIGTSSLGIASAATTNTSGNNTLAQKIASKFGIKQSDVQAVIDQNRVDHVQAMETKRADALKQAVADGKITQAQADHITAAWKEIDNLRGTSNGGVESTATRNAIRTKLDALKTWLDEQKIDLHSIDGLGGMRHRHGLENDDSETSKTSTSSSSTSS